MTDVLAVIAARAGSKRIPRKNLERLGDKPLIGYAIEQANRAKRVDRAIVSSEDEEIRRVARELGGEVPFERPDSLATDTATTNQVVGHALDWFEDRGQRYDAVCSVPVTTPFRSVEDIDGAVGQLEDTGAESVVGITEFDPPPFWAVERDDRDQLRPFFGEEYLWDKTRTQEVETLYRPNGAVFVATVRAFREHDSFYTDDTRGYLMPRERSLDIDEPFDLELARGLVEVAA